MNEIETKGVGEEEADFLYEVYVSSRMREVTTWGWEQKQIIKFLRMQYQCQQQSYLQHYPNLETKIIYFQNDKVGRLLLADFSDKQVIVDITILPTYQNRGIGTYVISTIQLYAMKQNKVVQLSVYYTNEQAKRLYERLGFQQVSLNEMYVHMEYI